MNEEESMSMNVNEWNGENIITFGLKEKKGLIMKIMNNLNNEI